MTEGTITEGGPIAGVHTATPPLSVWIALPPGATIDTDPNGNPTTVRFQCDARYLRRLAVALAEGHPNHL